MIPSFLPAPCSRARAFSLAAAVILGCTTLTAAQAGTSPVVTDTYITLSLPGVVGDFTLVPNAPPNAIQVLSVSVGAAVPVQIGSPPGKPSVSQINIAKAVDGASPQLFLNLVEGKTYATAWIQFWQKPTSGTTYTKTYTIYLTDAILAGFQNSGAGGDGSPFESLSFAFKTITLQDNINGNAACYNVLTNTSTGGTTC